MPLPLVGLDDLKVYLGDVPATDESLLSQLLAATIRLLNAQCFRERAPFSDALTGRVEVQEAVGGTRLRLDYPIGAVTSIKIGRNFASPEQTLDPTNADQVFFQVGDRELVRTDGEYWDQSVASLLSWQRGGPINGPTDSRGVPIFVQVTYNTQPDLPEEAALLVKQAVANIYRRRGSEAVKSETLGSYSYTLAEAAAADPVWQAFVSANQRLEAR